MADVHGIVDAVEALRQVQDLTVADLSPVARLDRIEQIVDAFFEDHTVTEYHHSLPNGGGRTNIIRVDITRNPKD